MSTRPRKRSSATLDLDRQNRFRQRYAATHPGWRESGQVYEATVRRHVRPDSRILDIGCGRGGLVELLQNQVALSIGLDPDLRSLLEHRQPEVRRVSGLAERLPFPDDCLDMVICSWLLEHLAKPQHVFHEVARVLRSGEPVKGKPGGHLVFLAPNAWHPLTWINRVLSRLGGWQTRLVRRLYERAAEDTFPPVYRANTRKRAERFAAAAGLTPVSLYTVGDPTYLAYTESFYRLATAVERVTPRWMKVHLVGDYIKT